MKTILAFGDGLTYGVDVVARGRHAYEDRWPSVLEARLAGKVRVIPEGLAGRTTVFNDEFGRVERNGIQVLPTLLHTHSPLDLVILFLGTNDLRAGNEGTALSAAEGIRRLVKIVWSHPYRRGCTIPAVLIVSPPRMAEPNDAARRLRLAPLIEQSQSYAKHYSRAARELGCGYFDAATVATASSIDGVHLDADNTRAIGLALVPVVESLLST